MKRREAIRNTAWFFGAASIAGSTAILHSCAPSLKDDWQPMFFTLEESALVAEIAETILPATDTPGAKDAKVERYLDQYAKLFLKPKEQEEYKQALALFDSVAKNKFVKSFVKLSSNEMGEVLQSMIDDPTKGEDSPNAVFHRLRSAVNNAFFTSEVGAKQVLDYNPIPGDYIGEVPLSSTKGRVYSG